MSLMIALPIHFGHDAALGVVGNPSIPTPVHFGDRTLHRTRDPVTVKDRRAALVARGAADRLDQRALGAQESFLVGVEDRDQGNTSGKSRPSRRRLMPTSTSNLASRRSRMISTRSTVSMSECR